MQNDIIPKVPGRVVVQEEGTTAAGLPKAPAALPLKWLTDKPGWVKAMAFNNRETAGFRFAGSGATKGSAY